MDEARRILRPLRDHEMAAFRETYGWMLFHKGEAEAALAILESAQPELAEVAEAQLHLGRVYLATGKAEAGRKALEAALRIARERGETRIAEEAEAALR